MRVISGSLRGMKLTSPEGDNTRPTLDRVKEAVFSMLLPYIPDFIVLDLFAGTGALGIEALSRGASRAVFVENNKLSAECVRKNLSAGRLTDCAELKVAYAQFPEKTEEKFDIIFLDPPYSENLYKEVIELIGKQDVLSEDGLIVAEWDYEFGFTDNIVGFQIVKEKKYGRVGITVLKRG